MSSSQKKGKQMTSHGKQRPQQVPTFVRHGSQDRYLRMQKSRPQPPAPKPAGKQTLSCSAQQASDQALLSILRRCESTSRPICFETIDVILRNKDAERMVTQLTGKPVDEAYRQLKLVQMEDFLLALEELAQHWKLINESKYAHRQKSYGIYNKDMIMIPHRQADAPFFSSQTIMSSCIKPIATNALGQRVTKAGREYLQHAAGLKVRFFEVTALIKGGLRQRLEYRSQAEQDEQADQGILNSVYNWFMAEPVQEQLEPAETSDAVLTDKKFLQALQRELKLFEVCLRIFEVECIETIQETQKEVQSQNIDALVQQERVSTHRSQRNRKIAQNNRYVPNQLLDSEGQLLAEHMNGRTRIPAHNNAIQIVPREAPQSTMPSPMELTRQTSQGSTRNRVGQKAQRVELSTFSAGSSQRAALVQNLNAVNNQAVVAASRPKQLFKNSMNSQGSNPIVSNPQHMRASTQFTSQVSLNIGSRVSSENMPFTQNNLAHQRKAASPVANVEQQRPSFDKKANGLVLSAGRLGHLPNKSSGQTSKDMQNQFYSSARHTSPLLMKHMIPGQQIDLQSEPGMQLQPNSDAFLGAAHDQRASPLVTQRANLAQYASSERTQLEARLAERQEALCVAAAPSDRLPNAEFMRKSQEYIIQASPSGTRLHSQTTSPQASNFAANVTAGTGPAIGGKALASKFAYGQAQALKQNEFEKATAVSRVFQVDGRKMSQESLGLSGRILSTSPRSSDIDENELSGQQLASGGLSKGPFVPFFNKSNIKDIAQQAQAISPQPVKQHMELNSQSNGDELENHHSAMILTPRQTLGTSSSNKVLSVQKTKEMEDRKRRILANRDQLQKHVELMHRAKQNIVR